VQLPAVARPDRLVRPGTRPCGTTVAVERQTQRQAELQLRRALERRDLYPPSRRSTHARAVGAFASGRLVVARRQFSQRGSPQELAFWTAATIEEAVSGERPASVRAANDRIAARAKWLHFVSRVPMWCECGEARGSACGALVMVNLDDYRQLRGSGGTISAPGHTPIGVGASAGPA
jgi:hypothetical protein